MPLGSVGLPSVQGSYKPNSHAFGQESSAGGSSMPQAKLLKTKGSPQPEEQLKANEDNCLLDEDVSKHDRSSHIFEQSTKSMLITIFNYIYSDIQKKKRSFKIGIFTFFLVVTFITILKSVVDVAPIAFLKVGQDQASLFDFQISSDYDEPYEDGDVNLYTSDPF